MTLSITILSNYAECCCAECHVLFIIMLNVVMLSVIMLSAVMLSVVAPCIVYQFSTIYSAAVVVKAELSIMC